MFDVPFNEISPHGAHFKNDSASSQLRQLFKITNYYNK